MTPNQASKKSNERKVNTNLQDRRVNQQAKYISGDLIRTADIKRASAKETVHIGHTNYTQ